jgi:hypothetical protein
LSAHHIAAYQDDAIGLFPYTGSRILEPPDFCE